MLLPKGGVCLNIAKEAKEELTKIPDDECCKAAFLSGVIHTAGVISIIRGGMRVIIESVNPFLAKTVFEIVGRLFGRVEGGGDGENTGGTGGDNDVENAADNKGKITVSGDFVPDMLLALRILKLRDGLKLVEGIDRYLVENECCRHSYLAGAFVGGGALSAAKGYHLEFACASKKLRDDIMRLLEGFEIKSAALSRGGKHIAYIKDKDKISDCLAFMRASKSVLQLNLLMAQRSLSQDVSRAANCDMANLNRMVAASVKQCEAISLLKVIKDAKLRETAEARLQNPDLSYGELAAVLGISKGALKYRLEKLVEMAENNQT